MRLAAYAGTSTVLATGVIIRAFHQRANFYSACVYLAQSNACLMILTNLVLLIVSLLMLGLQRLFYGPLRPIEVEQLYEKAWFAITETCLAMTIFRDEVGGWFLVMFVALLMGKVWEWIGVGRVEALEQQPPINPRLFHARLSFSLLMSLVFDVALLNYSVGTVLDMARPNMMVMFAFEFAILTIVSSSTAARYAISLNESFIIKKQTKLKVEERRAQLRAARQEASRQADQDGNAAASNASTSPRADPPDLEEIDESDIDVPGWEQKGQWIFYLDLATDFSKLVVYLAFFAILLIFYGIPIHIIRDVFLTLRSFLKRITDFLRYRRATRDMNERYPDATAEEIAREEVCIICREEMHPWQPNHAQTGSVDERARPKKLPCNHILHFGCLRSWLERQQICPTCRRSVMEPTANLAPGRNPLNANAANNRPLAWPGQQPLHGGAPQPGNANAQPPNGGRVINLGPLRIGFGVGGPNMFQDLAQRVHNGPQAQGQARNINVPPVNAGPRAFNFGMGFGAQPHGPNVPANLPPGFGAQLPIQTQLLQLETQILREIHGLQVGAEQLRVVQALHNELARLRQTHLAALGGQPPNVAQNIPANGVRGAPQAFSAHVPDSQRPAMGPNHANLPEGLNLPPGWTLMPLQRIDSGRGPPQPRSRSHEPAGSQPMGTATSPPGVAPSGETSGPALSTTQDFPDGSTDNGDSNAATRGTTTPLGSIGQLSASNSTVSIPLDGTADSGGSTTTHRPGQVAAAGLGTERSAPSEPLSAGDGGSNPSLATATAAPEPTPTIPIPAWGGQVQAAEDVRPTTTAEETQAPSRGPAVQPEPSDAKHYKQGQNGSATSSAAAATDGSDTAPTSSSREDKGKAKAATVEDMGDDVD